MNPALRLTLARLAAMTLLACAPLGASAGLLGDMTQMFMSNATAPGSIDTKDRVGVFGGSYEMRAPQTRVNLVSFDRPRFDAGCGGIDLYGGSFSFINGQQLVQIFRSVAANAVGLAFKAAIKAISPSLDALITEFQSLLQNMNNLAKNSCQLAHLVVDPAENALQSAVNGDGSVAGVKNNMFSDAMSGLTSYLQDANSYFKQQASVNPKAGNANLKLIMASGASASMGIAGLGNFDGSSDDATNPNSLNNRLLISLMGYQVNAVPCANQSPSGTPDSQASSSGTLPNLTCTGAATIKLLDLVNGGGTGSSIPARPLQLYSCQDPNGTSVAGGVDPQICTSMRLSDYDYPGIRAFINLTLFGTSTVTSTPTVDSIVGKYNTGDPFQLTAQQRTFAQQSGVSLLPLLGATSNPGVRISIASKLADHLVDCIAAAVGESLYKAANGVQTGGENTLSQDAKDNIERLRVDAMAERQLCLNDRKVLDVVRELNEATRLLAHNAR